MIAVEGAATSDDVVAMAPSADPDTMRWHEAMQQPERDDFKRTAQEEWDGIRKRKFLDHPQNGGPGGRDSPPRSMGDW